MISSENTERVGHGLPIQGIGGGGQGTAAQRRDIQAAQSVGQAVKIPQKHFRISQEMMPEGDGLGPLEVGVARHDGGGMRLRFAAEHPDELPELILQAGHRVSKGQAEIQRHLVIPAAAGVQPLARIPDPGSQLPFHKGVDILGVRIDFERSRGEVGRDGGKALPNLLSILCREDALLLEHGGVGHAPGDILLSHAAVEGDGGIEIVGFLVDILLEPAGPQFHGGTSFSVSAGVGKIVKERGYRARPMSWSGRGSRR